jgi:hypothetical protein
MLNEWSDRVPAAPRKPLLRRASFWIGVLVALGSAGFVWQLAERLLG